MYKKIKKSFKNNGGFTLIELVVVIAILGILATIAIPKVKKTKEVAEITAHNANVRTLESVANMYILDKKLPENEETILVNGDNNDKLKEYIEEVPKVPSSIKNKSKNKDDYYKVIISKDGKIRVQPKKVIEKYN